MIGFALYHNTLYHCQIKFQSVKHVFPWFVNLIQYTKKNLNKSKSYSFLFSLNNVFFVKHFGIYSGGITNFCINFSGQRFMEIYLEFFIELLKVSILNIFVGHEDYPRYFLANLKFRLISRKLIMLSMGNGWKFIQIWIVVSLSYY